MIVIAGVSGWEWLVLDCVTIIPQNLLCSLLLGKSHQASLQSESFSPDPLISYFLYLVSGHIWDLALELSFSMGDRVLAYL